MFSVGGARSEDRDRPDDSGRFLRGSSISRTKAFEKKLPNRVVVVIESFYIRATYPQQRLAFSTLYNTWNGIEG